MAGKSLLIQPGFDSRIRTYPAPMGVPVSIQRGFMIWDAKGGNLGYTGGPYGDGRDKINFLFNPSTINSSFYVANASLQAAMLYPVPGSTGTLLAPLQQTVNFELYFDRTYELNYGTGPGGYGTGQANDPGVIGCQADVIQFMQFTGMLTNVAASQSGVNALTGASSTTAALSGTTYTSSQLNSALGNGGIMIMVPCWLYFSNLMQGSAASNTKAQDGGVNAFGSQLSYYGYIDSWSVQYTHWTQQMVPIRCVINVEFTMLPTQAATSAQAVQKDIGYTIAPPNPNNIAPTMSGFGSVPSSSGIAGR